MRGVIALLVVGFLFVSISVIYPTVRSEEPVGNILYVGGSGSGNYSSIQGAIDNASEVDTIFVYNGTYYENVVVNKTVNLLGENNITTIIDGSNKGIVLEINAGWVNISGFTIKNSYNDSAAIEINSNWNTIFNNIITNNDLHGIYISFSSNNTISNNIISNNLGMGLGLWESPDTKIVENTVINNRYRGIDLTFSDNSIILNNIIIGNNYSGIGLGSSDYCKIFGNNISNNAGDYEAGVYLQGAEHNEIYNNSIINNHLFGIELFKGCSLNSIYLNDILENQDCGMIITTSSNNEIYKNNIQDNKVAGIFVDDWFFPPRSDYGLDPGAPASNNTIYLNNFLNDTAVDELNNTWFNNTLKEGNYWYDYNGSDKNNDGIGDTPYNIPGGNNQDRYPLMMPYDGTIRLKEFYVDYGSVFTMLIIGMIIIIIFLLPIAYIWYKKGWR